MLARALSRAASARAVTPLYPSSGSARAALSTDEKLPTAPSGPGSLWLWGRSDEGQLGADLYDINQKTPRELKFPKGAAPVWKQVRVLPLASTMIAMASPVAVRGSRSRSLPVA